MHSAWLWQCDHGHGAMGDTFWGEWWGDSWPLAYAAAVKHAMLYHVDHEVVEVVEL